jgi:homeobox protein cut-like
MSNESNQAKLMDQTQRQGNASCSFVWIDFSLFFADQEVVSKLAEVDMIVADLERANSRVATVERRNVST